MLLLGGCSAGGTEPDPAGGTTPPAATVESTVVAGANDAATETPTEPAADSDGVQQWYMQSADWAIKLEETHADESVMYWVDPIIE